MLATVASAWRLPATRQIGADQLSSVIRAMPAALVCGLVNAAIVAVGLWNDVSREAPANPGNYGWHLPSPAQTSSS
jgi:hypothetical protein